ncbi:THUMP domain-containing protein 2 [Clupea harengus]|uniref:THUMP domain-containing protein 2 n=1 Tax=Clupea harengus TaxID=7950 RepID=A0A6P3VLC3_CLUHA|nr:THUMP domain-containing protein 2 [Clupea harengus]
MDSAVIKDSYQCVRYFCTTGSGLEPFLVEEVKRKLSASDVELISGRVFFSTDAAVESISQLKSAERLFILLHRSPPIRAPVSQAKAASVVQQSIVGDPEVWEGALCTWSRLKTRLTGIKMTRKRKREEEEHTEAQGGHSRDIQSDTSGLQTDSEQQKPTFRVSCRSSGALARRFSPQDMSRLIGSAITKQLNWRADLKTPDLEVNVYLSDDHCVVGILLSSQPLAKRSYMKHTGLRSTVAWAMASVSNIKEGAVIIDPMCGVGTILLEAAQECPNACFFGLDSDVGQLQKATENMEFAQLQGRVQLLQASAMGIPLPSGSVDVVVCDVPFGRKFSCGSSMAAALPEIVKEMERVLCVGGSLVLLVSLQLSTLLKKRIPKDAPAPHTPSSTRCPASDALLSSETHTCATSTHHGDARPSDRTAPQPFFSLQTNSFHKVGLGNTDAIIHTYTKTRGL